MLQLTACSVDLVHGRVVRDGVETEALTAQERSLLQYLIDRAGEPVPRATLLEKVWGYSPKAVTRAVDVAVRRLRQKVEADPSDPDHVCTERGVGYRFVGPTPAAARSADVELVGRDADLARAREAMARGRLVTVQGASGVGKTRLAHALCPEGSWVRLHEHNSLASARAVLASGDPGDWVVLDGLEEHLPEGRSWVQELLGHGFGVVVTSVQRLGLPGEQVVWLGGLAEADGAQLLKERAQALVPAWGEESTELRAISRAVDGWPLGLELAAQRAPVLTPAALAEALADPAQRGGLLRRPGGEGRHDALERAFARTVQGLPEALMEAAAPCALLRGPFDVALASVVAQHRDLSPLDWLQGLVERSVLESVPVRGQPRFRVPRGLARWLRTHHPVSDDVVKRYHAAVLSVVERGVEERHGEGWRDAEQSLLDRADDLEHVWAHGTGEPRWRAAWLASRGRVGEPGERRRKLRRAVREAPAGALADRTRLALAYEDLAANQVPEALELLGSIEPAADDQVQHLIVTFHARLLSGQPLDLGELPTVDELRDEGLHEWVVRRLHIEAAWQIQQGDADGAMACFERMRDWALDHGHHIVQARALAEMGQLHWVAGEVEPAEEMLGQALDLLAGSHAMAARAIVLLQLGGLEAWRGDGATARVYLQEGFEAFARLGDHRYAAMAATNLGRVAYALGERAEARRWLRRAESLNGEGADPAFRYLVSIFLALTDRAAGHGRAARRHAEEAVELGTTDTLRSFASVIGQLCGGPEADPAPLRRDGTPLLAAWASLVDGGDVPAGLGPATVDMCVFLPSEWKATSR